MMTLFILILLAICGVLFFPLLFLYFVVVLTFKILFGLAWIFFSVGRAAVFGSIVLLLLFFKIVALLPFLLLLGLGLLIVGLFTGHRHRDVRPYGRDPFGPHGRGTYDPYDRRDEGRLHRSLSRMEERLNNLETILLRRGL
jgi:hypothetical protein